MTIIDDQFDNFCVYSVFNSFTLFDTVYSV